MIDIGAPADLAAQGFLARLAGDSRCLTKSEGACKVSIATQAQERRPTVKVKPSFISAVVFAFCFFVCAGITCGDDDDDDADVDDGDDDDDDVSGDVWTDSTSGLTWQVVPTGGDWLDLPSAESNCEGLILSGYNDWRLPTISEFRTLIRGCDATMTSGACGVTDSCLSDAECWNDFCAGCEYLAGPGLDGAYWPAEMAGKIDDFYWSSSPVTEYEGYEWCVNFSSGYIVNLAGYALARCVRP